MVVVKKWQRKSLISIKSWRTEIKATLRLIPFSIAIIIPKIMEEIKMKKIRLAALAFLVGGCATFLPLLLKLVLFVPIAICLWMQFDEYSYAYEFRGQS